MIGEPKCFTRQCRHLIGVGQVGEEEATEVPVCAAFPHGIPDEIAYGSNPHLKHYLGDQGIMYEKGTDEDSPFDLHDANPYHKGKGPGGGQFTSKPKAGEEVPFLEQYLRAVAPMSPKDKFILDHGKAYKFDESSFEGARDEAKLCYMNAGRIALNNRYRTYVEGYVLFHNVPIQHAWTVDKAGKVFDTTLKYDKHITAYFGVPFKTDYVAKTALRTKVWGIISHTNMPLFKAKSTKSIVQDFDPAQERDYHGRWVVESSTPAQDLLKLHHDDETASMADVERELTPAMKHEMDKADNEMKQLVPTNVKYLGPDGKYLPERAALHDHILREMFTREEIAHAIPRGDQPPRLILTGGRPAAGKTSALRGELGDRLKHSMYISADTIQEHLPGYDGRHAGLFNGEAQDIALRAEHIARQNRLNITYDATLKSQQPALDRVEQYKKAGYRVDGYFVHTSPTTSAIRSAARFMETGRYVPPAVSFNSRTNEKTFDALIPHLDKWAVYDNNGEKPRRVAGGGF